MKISLIQFSLIWENAKANRENLSNIISSIADADIIVLPEMFNTGFTMAPDRVAESMDGETVQWLAETAARKNCAITGSIPIFENGSYYNRLLFVFPTGQLQYYDKRHLFTLAGEEKVYQHGNAKLMVEYKGWKICPLICYDLRFPVFSRNAEQYDLLLYVANWPKSRIVAWDALLKARAIENMSYTIGVNRIGEDGNGLEYNGHSQIFDCLGNNIIIPGEDFGILTAELSLQDQNDMRLRLPFLNDRDDFKVT